MDGHLPKSLLKQIFYLTQRRLLSFFRDKADVTITFGQAPLMALAFFLVFNSLLDYTSLKSFEPLRKYATPDIIIFLAVLSAVWFGFDKAISEIPSSKTFYDQERLSFLSDSAFILSRFFALSTIAFGQVLLFAVVFHTIFVVIPASFKSSFQLTEQSLKGLRSENIPEDIIVKLKSLENKVYPKEDDFLKDLEGTIGQEQTVRYKSMILKSVIKASFQLTEQSLKGLERENVPENIIVKLESLKDKVFPIKDDFLKALEGTIGQEQTVQYKSMILKSAIPNKLMIELLIKFILLLCLTSIASVATAMVMSFFIKTPSAAKAILPFIIILQILMGGSRIRPLIDMKGLVYGFSNIMTSRWGFEPAALLFETHLENDEQNTDSIVYRDGDENKWKLQKRNTSDIQDTLKLVMLMNAVNSGKAEECINTLRQVLKQPSAISDIETVLKRIPLKRLTDIKAKATDFKNNSFKKFYEILSADKTKLKTDELITRIYNNFNEDLTCSGVETIFSNLIEGKDVEKHKEVWNWMVNVDPKIELFKPIHVLSAWFALFIISVSMLALLRILFWLRR